MLQNLGQSFRNIWDVPDLRKRVLFTLGLLAVYRLGNRCDARGPKQLIDGQHHDKRLIFCIESRNSR